MFARMLFAALLLSTADFQIVVHRSIPPDYWLMLNFIQLRQMCKRNGYIANIQENIILDRTHKHRPCKWNGVECEGDKVTAIHFKNDNGANLVTVSLDWIPPTCRTVHLRDIRQTDGFLAERLPREIRYLCLLRCTLLRNRVDERRSVDLQALPTHMEEFILIDGWFRGDLHIAYLPEKMRILVVKNAFVETVFVDYMTIPQKDFHMAFMRGKKAAEVLPWGDQEATGCLENGIGNLSEWSKCYVEYERNFDRCSTFMRLFS